MNKKAIVKGLIITVVSIGVILIVANNIKKGKKKRSNIELAQILQNDGRIKVASSIEGFESAFLQAWVDSLKDANEYFVYQGKKYWKQGGTAVK